MIVIALPPTIYCVAAVREVCYCSLMSLVLVLVVLVLFLSLSLLLLLLSYSSRRTYFNQLGRFSRSIRIEIVENYRGWANRLYCFATRYQSNNHYITFATIATLIIVAQIKLLQFKMTFQYRFVFDCKPLYLAIRFCSSRSTSIYLYALHRIMRPWYT